MDLWGVARRTGERLQSMGIHTAWQLSQADPKRIRRRLSVVYERMALELRWIPAIELEEMGEPRKQIMVSRAFGRLTDRRADVAEAVRHHAMRASEKLRGQKSLCRAVLVFIHTNPFRNDLPQYRNQAVIALDRPTADSRDILQAAHRGLASIYLPHYFYQKAGVMLLDLVGATNEQLSLFDEAQSDEERQRRDRLMSTKDTLNQRMGRGTVSFGGLSLELESANRTPRHTTR